MVTLPQPLSFYLVSKLNHSNEPIIKHPMQTKITWTGILYHCIEHCLLTKTAAGHEITSSITGTHENKNYQVDYSIGTNQHWELEWMDLQTVIDNSPNSVTVERKDGRLLLNGKPSEDFQAIYDVDISLTPFTNTLPVNRLRLNDGDQRVIDVLYFDILEKQIKPVMQVYTRISAEHYIYENYDKSFKADITIDQQGLVTDYPGLFAMTDKSVL